MAKIHTHYDNLKVARLAPQEVIRAAYKALSQKYHPDKNPGDEKAARIMAIINSAYGTLSDPQRRKEHDEWITAEEWEIEWLESERQRNDGDTHAWPGEPVAVAAPTARYRAARDPKWWFALVGVFGGGCIAGAIITAQPTLVSGAFASAMGGKDDVHPAAKAGAVPVPLQPVNAQLHPARDSAGEAWAVARPYLIDSSNVPPPSIKALTVGEVHIAPRTQDCQTDPHTLVAPNGEPWPHESAYVDGYPVAKLGEDMQITVNNSDNPSPVFVKVFDLEQRVSVRSVFVLAHDTMIVPKLATGKYELRYQQLDVGTDKSECAASKERIAQQSTAAAE